MRTLALSIACVACVTLPVHAQSAGSAADSPLWEVHVHLEKAFASPIGQRVLQMVESKEPDKYDDLLKLSEAIGLDPTTDIGEVVVFGDGFDETDVTVIASLGTTTGNLEGWILAAPGYRSEDLDDNTQLHSMRLERKDRRAWFALPQHSPSGNFILVGSLDQNRTVDLAQQVLNGNASPSPNPLQGDSVLSFFVNDLSAVPMKINEDDPGSALVRIIQRIGLNVASDNEQLDVAVNITANNPAKARQLSQLLTGLKAMLQLADEDEVKRIASIVEQMVVSHSEGQPEVQATMSVTYEVLEDLIQEMENKQESRRWPR